MLFSAAILAGGQSSRFGQDKASFVYQGKTMLEWVLESLKDADEPFIISNKPYPKLDLAQYQDLIVQQGPLSGIHAALSYAKHPWVAVAACDMPFLTTAYWQALVSYLKQKADNQAVLVKTSKGLEPLAAFYHKSALSMAEAQLNKQERSMQHFIAKLNTSLIPFEDLDLPLQTLANINTLKELD